ncbi:mapk-regulated corepressor-interacting protein 1-like isoform X2 [Megalops cyprinoides]|uniref:mapk-regulated corepressor-interacting protein 1-like isoform X2 n=1 Tax=Megalops cyprinoides TaxID=118141 RepID=UPI001863AAAC|nr:mapk-regulated corepressor-interacting protein 1-like isoform X2 [Megalops cyprinoides]
MTTFTGRNWLALAASRPGGLSLLQRSDCMNETEKKERSTAGDKESFRIREATQRSSEQTHRGSTEMTSSPAPRMVHNYKRTSSPRSPTNTGELFTPAHEENVRFIHDTWQCVMKEIKSPQSSERGPQEYVEKNPNPALHSFTPVDLSDIKRRNTQDSKKS